MVTAIDRISRRRHPPCGPLTAGVRHDHPHRAAPAAPHPGHRRVGVEQHPGAQHPGPLRVIWDNAPAHRGEAVREYLRTPELELRLVNPRFHEGRLCRATAPTSTPMRLSGAGRERMRLGTCDWGAGRRWRACPGVGRGEGRRLPGRAVQPERRGETALPDGPAIKGRNTPARLPPGPHYGDAPLELPHRNVGMGSAVGENRGIDGPPPGAQSGRVAGGQCAHRAAAPPWSQNGAPGPPKMGPWTLKTASHFSYTGLRVI